MDHIRQHPPIHTRMHEGSTQMLLAVMVDSPRYRGRTILAKPRIPSEKESGVIPFGSMLSEITSL